MKAPGYLFMTNEVIKRFTLKDLNLSDELLVEKYRKPWENSIKPFHWLLPKALRHCIKTNLGNANVFNKVLSVGDTTQAIYNFQH